MVAKYKKNKRAINRNLVLPIILGAVILLLISFLLDANLKLNKKGAELELKASILESELQTFKEQKDFLETQIIWSAEEDHLERIARDVRNLMREGEKAVVIIPPSDEDETQEEKEKKSFFRSVLDWF